MTVSDLEPPELPSSFESGSQRSQMSPSEARRRLVTELRLLREGAGLTLIEAATAMDSSAATISRIESLQKKGRLRLVDVRALLQIYRERIPARISDDDIARLERYLAESRKVQWFESFKDVTTGEMTPANIITIVEYEVDAREIRNYEPDLVPGLLQTYDYALAVGKRFFPRRPLADHQRFAEFRMQRQVAVQERSESRQFSFVVNEAAMHRMPGDSVVQRQQLISLLGHVRGEGDRITVRIVPLKTVTPAAVGGPFLYFSMPEDGDDILYLESRSGGTYLTSAPELARYVNYFNQLCDVALPQADAVSLLEHAIDQLPSIE